MERLSENELAVEAEFESLMAMVYEIVDTMRGDAEAPPEVDGMLTFFAVCLNDALQGTASSHPATVD